MGFPAGPWEAAKLPQACGFLQKGVNVCGGESHPITSFHTAAGPVLDHPALLRLRVCMSHGSFSEGDPRLLHGGRLAKTKTLLVAENEEVGIVL